jgi:hypothetical protein
MEQRLIHQPTSSQCAPPPHNTECAPIPHPQEEDPPLQEQGEALQEEVEEAEGEEAAKGEEEAEDPQRDLLKDKPPHSEQPNREKSNLWVNSPQFLMEKESWQNHL